VQQLAENVDMRRRDFLLATSSLAAVALPGVSRAAIPCPPPSFSTGSQTVTTACPTASGALYSTNFPLAENPISEGSRWLGGFTDGVVFKDVRTSGGRAFASGINNTYDDSLAILNSPAIPNDHFVEVVVYIAPGYQAPSSHEIELLLRGNISRSAGPNYAPLYEVLIPFGGTNGSVIYQDGSLGGWQELSTVGSGYDPLVTGDVIRAQIIGSNISVFVNGKIAFTANDSRHKTGKPGMGFFVRPGGTPQNYCISSFKAGAA
jgi:hypothetical protein